MNAITKPLALIILISLSFKIQGQGGNPGNLRTPVNFLGFNGAGPNNGPLDIRNDFLTPIAF
jgi:hypothetical protein